MACSTPCGQILSASRTVTECQCLGDGPVSCALHQCEKTAHLHRLCQTRPDYFRLWNEGRGPGQMAAPQKQSPLPLGTWLAALIKRATFGKVSPCTACESRAAKLDRIGERIARWFGAP